MNFHSSYNISKKDHPYWALYYDKEGYDITGNKIIELGTEFTDGIASSEINNESGDIIYLDNRQLISRDARQKEDIKVILEF